jgi:thymidylate synthase (FAD)
MTDTQKFTHNPVIFTGSQVDLVDHMGDDVRACMAARVSLLNDDMLTDTDMSISAKDLKLIHFLMREKHTSPFEHSVLSFRITAPLPVVAQIMRHRTFSYNQASRRYTSDDIEFFDMNTWRQQGTKNLQCSDGDLPDDVSMELRGAYHEHCVRSLEVYQWMLEKGASREQARFVLPQGLMARFYMTGNLHNFLKFIILRDSSHAQEECAEIARHIKEYMELLFPRTMEIFANLQVSASTSKSSVEK